MSVLSAVTWLYLNCSVLNKCQKFLISHVTHMQYQSVNNVLVVLGGVIDLQEYRTPNTHGSVSMSGGVGGSGNGGTGVSGGMGAFSSGGGGGVASYSNVTSPSAYTSPSEEDEQMDNSNDLLSSDNEDISDINRYFIHTRIGSSIKTHTCTFKNAESLQCQKLKCQKLLLSQKLTSLEFRHFKTWLFQILDPQWQPGATSKRKQWPEQWNSHTGWGVVILS